MATESSIAVANRRRPHVSYSRSQGLGYAYFDVDGWNRETVPHTYDISRASIALGADGARFGPSGWELTWDTTGLAPRVHRLYLYAHRTTDDGWSLMPSHLILVVGGPTIWLPIGLHNR